MPSVTAGQGEAMTVPLASTASGEYASGEYG
jgi:hypothetical protein